MKLVSLPTLQHLLLLSMLVGFSGTASAFCVYNSTPFTIDVFQAGGGKTFKEFHKRIKPGNKACCNWKNKDCNKTGKRDSLVRFSVEVEFGNKRKIIGPDWTRYTRNMYCGLQDNSKDKYRLIHAQAGGAVDVYWHGPLVDGRWGGDIERDWLRTYTWTYDGKLQHREQCHTNEKGWTPGDLF